MAIFDKDWSSDDALGCVWLPLSGESSETAGASAAKLSKEPQCDVHPSATPSVTPSVPCDVEIISANGDQLLASDAVHVDVAAVTDVGTRTSNVLRLSQALPPKEASTMPTSSHGGAPSRPSCLRRAVTSGSSLARIYQSRATPRPTLSSPPPSNSHADIKPLTHSSASSGSVSRGHTVRCHEPPVQACAACTPTPPTGHASHAHRPMRSHEQLRFDKLILLGHAVAGGGRLRCEIDISPLASRVRTRSLSSVRR